MIMPGVCVCVCVPGRAGCEEFWYTNLPDSYASDLGFCGGGAYREIQVRLAAFACTE
jgi:hypothetical protein